MRSWRVGVLALALALVSGAVAGAPSAAADPASAEQDFVVAINRLRAGEGLAPVRSDAELTAIARRWAGRMADAGAISHNAGFAGEVGQDWRKLGENVGRGPDVADLVRAFVASPTHLANLVDPEFELVGVGVVERGGQLWTSHQFMVLFDEPAPPPPPPAPLPPPPATAGAPSPAGVPSPPPPPGTDAAPVAPAVAPAGTTRASPTVDAGLLRDLRTLDGA